MTATLRDWTPERIGLVRTSMESMGLSTHHIDAVAVAVEALREIEKESKFRLEGIDWDEPTTRAIFRVSRRALDAEVGS